MIGSLNSEQKAMIVGGGISGTLAAYYLARNGYEVELFEKSNRLGGLIQTRHTAYGIAETAAHSIQATSEVLQLFKELNLNWLEVKKNRNSKYIFRDGKMRKFPLYFSEWFSALPKVFWKKSKREIKTVEQWAIHHFGEPAHQYLFQPMVSGIYAAQSSEIVLEAAFPHLQIPVGYSLLSAKILGKLKKVNRSREIITIKQGMESLKNTIEEYLQSCKTVSIKKGEEVEDILYSEADSKKNILICTSSDSAARLLKSQDPYLSQALEKVKYAPLICATVFFEKASFNQEPNGVGVLIPESNQLNILGVLFNSSMFPDPDGERVRIPEAHLSLTVMMGSTKNPECLDWDDSRIQETILNDLGMIFGQELKKAVHFEIFKWKRAIPIYSQELVEAWTIARQGWCGKAGHILFGNYTGQVSLRGLIQSAQQITLNRQV